MLLFKCHVSSSQHSHKIFIHADIVEGILLFQMPSVGKPPAGSMPLRPPRMPPMGMPPTGMPPAGLPSAVRPPAGWLFSLFIL